MTAADSSHSETADVECVRCGHWERHHPGGYCEVVTGNAEETASVPCPCGQQLVGFVQMEAIFDRWCDELVRHHGDRSVAAVLSSPAIQAAFVGEVHQFAQADQQFARGMALVAAALDEETGTCGSCGCAWDEHNAPDIGGCSSCGDCG